MLRNLLSIVGLLLLTTSSAQVVGLEVGAQAGTSHYFGDLNPELKINKPGLSAGLLARYCFNKRIAIKAGFNYAHIAGDDALSQNEFQVRRNLSFQSHLLNGGLQLEFNFLPFIHGDKKEFFSPYLFGGLSMTHYNPKADYNGSLVELRELGTEGQFPDETYNLTDLAWLYGGGVKVSLSFHWSINVELALHQTFTDYLDDVSTTYPDMIDLGQRNGPTAVALSDRSVTSEGQSMIGQPGRQRGNSAVNDSYAVLSVGVTYFLGRLNCPSISEPY